MQVPEGVIYATITLGIVCPQGWDARGSVPAARLAEGGACPQRGHCSLPALCLRPACRVSSFHRPLPVTSQRVAGGLGAAWWFCPLLPRTGYRNSGDGKNGEGIIWRSCLPPLFTWGPQKPSVCFKKILHLWWCCDCPLGRNKISTFALNFLQATAGTGICCFFSASPGPPPPAVDGQGVRFSLGARGAAPETQDNKGTWPMSSH